MPDNPELARFLESSRLALDPETAEALAAEMWSVTLTAGEFLFHQGDPSSRFFVVRSGTLDVGATSIDGKELVFTSLTSGDVIGEATVVDGEPRSASIRARNQAEVVAIGRERFLELAAHWPALSIGVARLAAETLRRLSNRVEGQTFDDLGSRLAGLLLQLGDETGGSSVTVAVTQQALADRLGVARESVNKHLRVWNEHGLVELGRGRVIIADTEALGLHVR